MSDKPIELKSGKFGMYFFHTKQGRDLDLKNVLHYLNQREEWLPLEEQLTTARADAAGLREALEKGPTTGDGKPIAHGMTLYFASWKPGGFYANECVINLNKVSFKEDTCGYIGSRCGGLFTTPEAAIEYREQQELEFQALAASEKGGIKDDTNPR